MKFRFEKEGYIPSGALAYTEPTRAECEKAYEQLRTICLDEVNKRYLDEQDMIGLVLFEREVNKRYIDVQDMIGLVLFELDCYRMNKQIMELLILREIAAFSHENGYPVMLPGMENKLVLFELLGITNVCPMRYGRMAFANFPEAEPMFEIHVAAQIREKLPDRLNAVFGSIDSAKDREKHIIIQPFEALDCIGELAARTGVPYQTIDIANLHAMGDPELLNALAEDVITKELGWQSNAVPCRFLTDVARLYAFAHCNADEKTPELFVSIGPYIFRDRVYTTLLALGFPTPIAFRLARNWAKGDEKERDMEMMRRHGAFSVLLEAYRHLQNQWPESSCMAHVTVLAILKYYELRYPDVYAQIRAKYDAQETE